jgi:hypothetical protein
MSDILIRIKRAVLTGNYAFSGKARLEMECDGRTELDVVESILSAVAVYKLRSTSPSGAAESTCTSFKAPISPVCDILQGKLVSEANVETYYLLVSSKRAV